LKVFVDLNYTSPPGDSRRSPAKNRVLVKYGFLPLRLAHRGRPGTATSELSIPRFVMRHQPFSLDPLSGTSGREGKMEKNLSTNYQANNHNNRPPPKDVI
jgi:hypothetical protein